MEYECPKCRNTEHPVGSNFCKICGMKIDKNRMENNSKSPQGAGTTSEENDFIQINGVEIPREEFKKILREAPLGNPFEEKAETIKPCIVSKECD